MEKVVRPDDQHVVDVLCADPKGFARAWRKQRGKEGSMTEEERIELGTYVERFLETLSPLLLQKLYDNAVPKQKERDAYLNEATARARKAKNGEQPTPQEIGKEMVPQMHSMITDWIQNTDVETRKEKVWRVYMYLKSRLERIASNRGSTNE